MNVATAAQQVALPAAIALERIEHTTRVTVPGVEPYRVMEPVFEGVRVALKARGEKYSPAYIQGISGAAFRIAGPCPCAPTCACAMSPDGLLKLLGYRPEALDFRQEGDVKARLQEVLPRIRDEIRAGRPVLVFHAFTYAEWDVVSGYDEAKKQFLGRGSYAGQIGPAVADAGRMVTCTDICPIGGALLIGPKTGTFDARAAEIASLQGAVKFAHSTSTDYPFPGLQCYEKWIAAYGDDPAHEPDYPTDGYTSAIYRSTHRMAAAYLREIRPRYPKAVSSLEGAARHFAREAAALSSFHDLLFDRRAPMDDSPQLSARARGLRASELLATARDEYRAGIADIENALKAM